MNQVRVDEEFSSALRAELVARGRQAAPAGVPLPGSRCGLVAGALAGAGLVGGMVAGGAGLFGFPASQQVSPQPSALASYRAEDTLAAFSGVSIDYDPLGSPEALAAVSQVIVQGTVNGVREGRTTSTGVASIVLIVEVQKVAQGELPQGNDGNIYLELPAGGHPDPSYYTKAFPQGTAVVAYMRPASDGLPREGIDVKIENPEAGRPAGQALYIPTGPQGLALQVGEEDVVWPLIGARAPGEIADTLPGGGLIAH